MLPTDWRAAQVSAGDFGLRSSTQPQKCITRGQVSRLGFTLLKRLPIPQDSD